MQSQLGAKWNRDFTNTMNSGFAAGTPRTEKRKGVREGRETGVPGMPAVKGVGRTGKGPAPVPFEMQKAARRPTARKQVMVEVVEDEDRLSLVDGRVKQAQGRCKILEDGGMVVYEGVGRGPPPVKKKRQDIGKIISVVRSMDV